MFYFTTRSQARTFAARKDVYRQVDCGSDAPTGQRWAVKVL